MSVIDYMATVWDEAFGGERLIAKREITGSGLLFSSEECSRCGNFIRESEREIHDQECSDDEEGEKEVEVL